MMAGARHSARCYGKSDPIAAACVARAALRERGLPEASLAGPEHTFGCSSIIATTCPASANASKSACVGTATILRSD